MWSLTLLVGNVSIMTPSKNRSGFTLVEVMAALAIFALVATPIFLLESSMARRVANSSRRFERISLAKNFLYDARIAWQKSGEEPKSIEKVLEKQGLKLRYEPKKVSGSSVLKSVYGLYCERVTIEWKDVTGKQHEDLVAYLVVPPTQPKEAK